MNSAATDLGSITKSQANQTEQVENGYIHDHSQGDRRLRKYDLLHHAGEILPNERVSTCMQTRISADSPVELLRDAETGRGGYSNLIRCGSVWHCPICASKISEERKEEMQTAIERWEAQGGGVGMLTLTLQHLKHEKLIDILPALQTSLTRFWGHRRVKEIQVELGIVGKIRALETTYSVENGWHPHVHILLFFDDAWMTPSEIDEFQVFMAREWTAALEKSYKFASMEHGVDFRWADSAAADYVSKFGGDSIDIEKTPENWGPATEMAKSAFKMGKQGSVAPFELLSLSAYGNKKATRLFTEYAMAFKGRRQIIWSRGLKTMLGLNDATDEELAAEQGTEAAEVVAQLNFVAWRSVVRGNLLGILLDAVENSEDLWAAKLSVDMILYQNDIITGYYVPDLHKTAYEIGPTGGQ